MNHALLTALAAANLVLLSSCEQSPMPGEPTDTANSEPYIQEPSAITKLRRLDTGTIQFDLSINGTAILLDQSAGNQQTAVVLAESEFDQATNSVEISFSFRSNNGSSHELASTRHSISRPSAGESIVLSGLMYSYADTDNDGVYNVHELAVEPADIDNDLLDNVNDPDSDGDGSNDGQDPDPYNTGISNQDSATLQFDLIHQNNRTERIQVFHSAGIEEELIHLVNTLGGVNLITPPLWPASAAAEGYSAQRWKAFVLGNGSQSLCPDLRIGIDTSSLKTNLSAPALLYFRRHDGSAFMLPVTAHDIPRLDNYQGGVLDDGLRIILVAEAAVGWIELWTQQSYNGELCTLNLSTPVKH